MDKLEQVLASKSKKKGGKTVTFGKGKSLLKKKTAIKKSKIGGRGRGKGKGMMA